MTACMLQTYDRISNLAERTRTDACHLLVYKPGKVAVVLSGRQAGKKVVVIKQVDEGTKERPYPHAIVAGIEKSVQAFPMQDDSGLTIIPPGTP
jgi:hypothetical protein